MGRQAEFGSSDLGEITLVSPGDVFVLYTDGVYDGSDEQARELLEGSWMNTTANRQRRSATHC
jgi:serine phosphatase RsbU (regulator of sigma subunit)